MAFTTILPSFPHSRTPFPTLQTPLPRPPTKTLALPPLPLSPNLSLDSPTTLAILTSAALAAALSLTDPERRRQQQALQIGGTDKEVVRDYFNTTGFTRWKKIYGDAIQGVNKVQLDIRHGHSKTVQNAILMLKEGGSLSRVSICDAGCGTGSLAIPLAREGAVVTAADISSAMVEEARRQAEESIRGVEGVIMPRFEVNDLEDLEGKYHTVVCLDVLIHYPQEKAEGMIAHLASLAEKRLLISFAPKTVYYSMLKRIGEMFPGASKATRAYLHGESDVEGALERLGWRVRRRGFVSTQFYFAKLFEAVPVD